jgi:NMD protein affecting ribosome stability and mRNA decay
MTNYCERCGTENIEDGEILCEECDKETEEG